MTDNQLFAILMPIVKSGLTARGLPDVAVLQKPQPIQQGTTSGPVVYLTNLFSTPRGHVRRDTVYDEDLETMTETELQTYEQTYQVNAFFRQDPSDLNSPSASDIVKKVRQILQSSAFIAGLREHGLAILRINELRNPTFVDESDRYEYNPSFDFTLTYDELSEATAEVVTSVEYNINRV